MAATQPRGDALARLLGTAALRAAMAATGGQQPDAKQRPEQGARARGGGAGLRSDPASRSLSSRMSSTAASTPHRAVAESIHNGGCTDAIVAISSSSS
jgi:hypothetical protein